MVCSIYNYAKKTFQQEVFQTYFFYYFPDDSLVPYFIITLIESLTYYLIGNTDQEGFALRIREVPGRP